MTSAVATTTLPTGVQCRRHPTAGPCPSTPRRWKAPSDAPYPAPPARHPATKFERITFEPGKMGGRAVIRGLRITVGTVLARLAEGCPEAEIRREYPDLEAEDLRQVLAYAAWLVREDVLAV